MDAVAPPAGADNEALEDAASPSIALEPIEASSRAETLVASFRAASFRRAGSASQSGSFVRRAASTNGAVWRRAESIRSDSSKMRRSMSAHSTGVTASTRGYTNPAQPGDSTGSVAFPVRYFGNRSRRNIHEGPSKGDDMPGMKTDHAVFGPGANIKSTEEFFEQEPEEASIRREGVLKKRVVAKDIAWRDKYVTLTDEKLLLRNEPNGEIRDTLDLRAITSVRQMIDPNRAHEIDSFRRKRERDRVFGATGQSPAGSWSGSSKGIGKMLQQTPPDVDHVDPSPEKFKTSESSASLEQVHVHDISDGKGGDQGKGEEGGAIAAGQEDAGPVNIDTEIDLGEDGCTAQANNEDERKKTGLKNAAQRIMTIMKFSKSAQDRNGKDSCMTESFRGAEWRDVMEVYEQSFGRTYYFRCEDEDACAEWVQSIQQAKIDAEEAYQRSLNISAVQRTKIAALNLYQSDSIQMAVCVVLFANFIISIIQCEKGLNSKAADYDKELALKLDFVELVFTFIYLAELVLHMFGAGKQFFLSSWCLLDLAIVIVSVVDAVYVIIGETGNGLAVLRLLRIFRIVRIFNKLGDMKRILSANVTAFGPVINAMLFFAVTVAIYAVIAVNLFDQDTDVGICAHNSGCFSSFSMAFYSLLGIATGESWTGYVRNINVDHTEGIDASVAIFFVSFVSLVGIVAINIIVAVLLENFVSSMTKYDTSKRVVEEAREHHKSAEALDPLLSTLSNFSSPQHFKSQIDLLFCLWDVDDNGTIDAEEMNSGIQRLGYEPPIQWSSDDWENFSLQGLLLNKDGEFDPQSFELAMRFQLADYSQRLLANKMQQSVRMQNEYAPVLFGMKMVMLEIMSAATDRRSQALQSDIEFEKLNKHLQVSNDRAPPPGVESPLNSKSVHNTIANLTSLVTTLMSRMEDVLKAQSEMQKSQSDMQKQLGDIQAAIHHTS